MPATFPIGSQGLHYVSTDWDGTEAGVAAATWTAVDGLGDYTRGGQANTTPHRIYGRSTAVVTVGIPDRTITLNGWYVENTETAMQGQEILRAHSPEGASANVSLGYAYLRDGTSGYAVLVQVGGGDETSNAEGGLQPVTFTLAPQNDPVEITAGIP
jgi:hypothetical protein